MNDLENIKLGISPFEDKIFLYRHGRDPATALDKRDATRDVVAVIIKYMMRDAPKGSRQKFLFGDKSFEITVKPRKI